MISPMLPASCRYTPSCSEYTIETIKTHGPVKGSVLSLARLGSCHPWSAGGWDPVPPRDLSLRAAMRTRRAACPDRHEGSSCCID